MPGAVTDLVIDYAQTTTTAFFVKWTKPVPGPTLPVSEYQVTITDVDSGTEIVKTTHLLEHYEVPAGQVGKSTKVVVSVGSNKVSAADNTLDVTEATFRPFFKAAKPAYDMNDRRAIKVEWAKGGSPTDEHTLVRSTATAYDSDPSSNFETICVDHDATATQGTIVNVPDADLV